MISSSANCALQSASPFRTQIGPPPATLHSPTNRFTFCSVLRISSQKKAGPGAGGPGATRQAQHSSNGGSPANAGVIVSVALATRIASPVVLMPTLRQPASTPAAPPLQKRRSAVNPKGPARHRAQCWLFAPGVRATVKHAVHGCDCYSLAPGAAGSLRTVRPRVTRGEGSLFEDTAEDNVACRRVACRCATPSLVRAPPALGAALGVAEGPLRNRLADDARCARRRPSSCPRER